MAKAFDANLNHLTDGHPNDWVAYLCARTGVPPGPAEILDTDLATTVQADKLFRVNGSVPAALHLELESSGHLGRPAGLLRYNVLAHVLTGLPVHSVVLLLRPKANSTDLTGELTVTGAHGRVYLTFRYHVVRLWEESIDSLLAGGIGLAPLTVLTDESERDLAAAVARMHDRLRGSGAPANVEKDLIDSAFILGGLRHPTELLADLYRSLSMSINLEESTTYQMILRRGGAQVGQDILLRQGRARFGPATTPIEAAVRGISDIERLERMAERLLTAASWDEVLATP